MTGAAVRFYVVCIILQRFVFEPQGVPFAVTTVILVLLIWLYTRTGGIKTLVWTDSLQTLCLFTALLIIIYKVATDLNLTLDDAISAVSGHELSRVFVLDDWASKQNFWKQFLSGIFVVLVMTGVDQDMMQKNLTCKTLRGAEKDMCTYGVAFLPANLLFLSLGILLTMWYQQQGLALPASGDDLLPGFVSSFTVGGDSIAVIPTLFVLGIVAASFSSADSALTSLTTIYCVDIMGRKDDERLRKRAHIVVCVIFVLFILFFKAVNSTSLIDAIYIICGYTYGPLLGLFAYGLLTKRGVNDRLVPYIAVASPILCYAIDYGVGQTTGYHFGYELLMLNGLITFVGLYLTSKR
jgi:Na+/proline symporter